MGLRDLARAALMIPSVERSGMYPLPGEYFANLANWGGMYPLGFNYTIPSERAEEYAATFAGYTQAAYRSNGVVYACCAARMSLFSEARFQFRRLESGRPGDLFGTQELAMLEEPWPNGTTGDLLVRMEQDDTLTGNFYAWARQGQLYRMRPDWVSVVLGSNMTDDPDEINEALDARVIGYGYHPGGYNSGKEPIPLLASEVVHYAPRPDPERRYVGLSWLSSIMREIQGDNVATNHKVKYFEGGATPNQAIIVPIADPAEFDLFVQAFRARAGDPANAYKHLLLNQGFDTKSIGNDLTQVDFKAVQGAGETRIAAAAEVPPIIVGLSEGLEAATYSNYGLAMRRFADLTMRPRWRNAAAALGSVINIPSGAELWYDDRDIPALREDVKASAEAADLQAKTIRTYIDAGYEPDSAAEAVMSGDLSKLRHSGLVSVQLQEPGAKQPEAEQSANGDGGGDLAEQARTILGGAP